MSHESVLPAVARHSGSVYFPLASNAHSLVTGQGVQSVRRRLKVSSLLYNKVLLEAGQLTIQAGARGAIAGRRMHMADESPAWQTPMGRRKVAGRNFSLSVAPETVPGIPAKGPYYEVVSSPTSVNWWSTLEPFIPELPSGCDWIEYGRPSPVPEDFKRSFSAWRDRDRDNPALVRLVPEHFVRSQIVDNVSDDMVVGAAGGWDVSVDRLHGNVLSARTSSDATVLPTGFALPILLPNVGTLSWNEVRDLRRLKPLAKLRRVLQEIEADALDQAQSNGDVERAVHVSYQKRLAEASTSITNLGHPIALAIAGLVVGVGAGYATMGLALYGPLVGTIPAAGFAAWDTIGRFRNSRRRSWVGASEAISSAVQQRGRAFGLGT